MVKAGGKTFRVVQRAVCQLAVVNEHRGVCGSKPNGVAGPAFRGP